VLVCGIPLAQYAVGDRMSEAQAMVSLVEQGWADQNDVAGAFGYCSRTLRRQQHRFEEGGLVALSQGAGYPKGRPRQPGARSRLIHRLKSDGHSNREIARRVGISEMAIRKTLRRMGWQDPTPQIDLPLEVSSSPSSKGVQEEVGKRVAALAERELGANPNLSAFSSSPLPAPTQDTDPSDRWMDRLLARLGALDDAAPLFGSGPAVSGAGVLLALPALVATGVFDSAHQIYGSLGPAFFGLRTTFLTLLLMALWRIRRPEALKEHPPAGLGRVLGLDRAPEVKTLRRKLAELGRMGRAAQLGRALAQHRIAQHGAALGFLYVDGHVRVYHGKHDLPKTHVSRMRLPMPATSDYWVNESTGDPLFVLTAEANANLVKMLPGLLQEMRALLGPRRVTMVFDRGGYSPRLFQQILALGFDLLTYRKGRVRPLRPRCFRLHRTRVAGRTLTYLLADQEVRLLRGRFVLRQVTRRTPDGHQTPILTSRRDLSAAQVAYRMFERWRQENFFKYLRQEFALDALAEYAVVPDDPNRQVRNPALRRLEVRLRAAQAQWDCLQAEYGLAALTCTEAKHRTLRGFKIAQHRLGRKIWEVGQRILQLRARRRKLPQRVPLQSVRSEPPVKLAPEIQHLSNLLKMVAFQAESDLVRLLAPHYPRVEDEGRTLLQAAFLSAADLEVTATELRVTLLPQSSPHRTRAIGALCQELNARNTLFPGSQLRLRFAIHTPA
jgi:prepilin-type processing-associated H-X9-DG protein